MKTEFAKAIEAGEDVVGKEVVCVCDEEWVSFIEGDCYTVLKVYNELIFFNGDRAACVEYANDFEFKHVLDKQKEQELVEFNPFKNQCLAKFLAEADEENKRLKEQLEGAIEINKQYEQQLFDLRMENARLELAAQRWEMFDCEANRNIADKLLKKLADDAVETYN